MAITIQTFGENETPDAIKAAYPDADVEITKQAQTPPAKESNSADELKAKQEEEAKAKEEAEPNKPPEKEEKPPAKAAKAKESDDEGFPKEAIDQIAKLRRERREAREKAEDLEAENARLKKAGEPRGTATAEVETPPDTYCGRPKPTIDQYTSQPEKYPDPYAAHSEAVGEWFADEKLAKRDYETAQRQAEAVKAEQIAHYEEAREKMQERFPDLEEVIHSDAAKKVLLSEGVIAAIRESEVGPAVLRHLILNPEIASGWLKKPPASQVAAYGKLETQIEAELTTKAPDKKAEATPPAKQKQSSAPEPPARLKPSGNPAHSSRDIAGDSGNITTIVYDPAYERRRREEGYKGY